MASKAVKKRAWGKSKEQDKITIIENMELELPDKPKLDDSRTVIDEDRKEVIDEDRKEVIDLQHPEMLSNERLVKVLSEMKVPIPVYQNGSPSRERLIYLFCKYVMPRPQRKRRPKIRHKEPSDLMSTSESVQLETMEWEKSDKLSYSAIEENSSLQRKRRTEHSESLPLSKRPVIETSPPSHPTLTTHIPVRKIKRPIHNLSSEKTKIIRTIESYNT